MAPFLGRETSSRVHFRLFGPSGAAECSHGWSGGCEASHAQPVGPDPGFVFRAPEGRRSPMRRRYSGISRDQAGNPRCARIRPRLWEL